MADSDAPFPRKALVIPGLIPLALLGALFGAETIGIRLNPHGIPGIIVLLVMIWGFAAGLFELVIIFRAAMQLARSPVLRITENLLAISFAVLFVLSMIWLGL